MRKIASKLVGRYYDLPCTDTNEELEDDEPTPLEVVNYLLAENHFMFEEAFVRSTFFKLSADLN